MLPPEVFAVILDNAGACTETCELAAHLAIAGAFGRDWKGYLRKVYAAQARRLGCDDSPPNFEDLATFRRDAKVMGYTRERMPWLTKPELRVMMPRLAPPQLVGHVRHKRIAQKTQRDLENVPDGRMTELVATETYGLARKDLAPYRCVFFYNERDVARNAFQKYGGAEGLAKALQHDRQLRLKTPEVRQRTQHLEAALEARGLALREDSSLCRCYIKYDAGNVEEIVDSMEDMAFFYEHTNFQYMCKELRAEHYWWSSGDIIAVGKHDAMKELVHCVGAAKVETLPHFSERLRGYMT